MAWPIRPDYAAGVSYWIYEAEKKYGLNVESLKLEYDAKTEQPKCAVQFNPEDGEADDYTQISLLNLFFPFVFFGSFAVVAFVLQLYAVRMRKKRRRGLLDSTFIGRNSTLGLVRSFTKKDLGIKDDPDLRAAMERAAMEEGPSDHVVLGVEEKLRLDDSSYHTADVKQNSNDFVLGVQRDELQPDESSLLGSDGADASDPDEEGAADDNSKNVVGLMTPSTT